MGPKMEDNSDKGVTDNELLPGLNDDSYADPEVKGSIASVCGHMRPRRAIRHIPHTLRGPTRSSTEGPNGAIRKRPPHPVQRFVAP